MASDGLPDQPGPRRQTEIYMEGLADVTPDTPIAPEVLATAARETLDGAAYDYVAGGAGSEATIAENRRAFTDWLLVPRVLRDIADRDLTTEVFGTQIPAPVCLAPIGAQSIIHERGDKASAAAAANVGLPYVGSCVSSIQLETVADVLGDTAAWFQLYWPSDRELAASLVDRAVDAGFDALVLTVDTPILGWRERDLQRGFLPFLEGEGLANYFSDPVFRARLDQPPAENELAAIREFVDVFGNPAVTFDDLAWLTDRVSCPVIVKGLVHPDDARQAVVSGAAGVWVSSHGGRQVDSAMAALDALPEIVDAVDASVPVCFDSGIRRGADVLTALALGADIVGLGRPYAYGLAIDGENGVRTVCENLLADLDLTMGLCGRSTVAAIDRDVVVRAG